MELARRRPIRLALGVGSIALMIAASAWSQSDYSVAWGTIAGGGGISTGTTYSVQGTIGQSALGEMSGGEFGLRGGFWSLVVAVQTPGAPLLSITRSNGTVVIAWPRDTTGWTLQSAPGPNVPGDWSVVPTGLYQTNATEVFITINPPAGRAFFRLRKPGSN